jgi:hypothetical protein
MGWKFSQKYGNKPTVTETFVSDSVVTEAFK